MPLSPKERADLAASLIASIPEYPKKAVASSCCGVKLVFDAAAADLREDAIEVAHTLLGED